MTLRINVHAKKDSVPDVRDLAVEVMHRVPERVWVETGGVGGETFQFVQNRFPKPRVQLSQIDARVTA